MVLFAIAQRAFLDPHQEWRGVLNQAFEFLIGAS